MSNIILIGMPGSGKSTVGVLLAKALGYSFEDVDLVISRRAGKPLQKILDEDGLDSFLTLEEAVGSTIAADHTVIFSSPNSLTTFETYPIMSVRSSTPLGCSSTILIMF